MHGFWFEIVRRSYDRYGWVFVEVQEGRRRVLARSERDYRTKKRLKCAIDDLKKVLPGGDVIDATGSTDPDGFPLPTTHFQLVPGVVPLMVGDGSVDHSGTASRRRGRRRGSVAVGRRGSTARARAAAPAAAPAQAAATATTSAPASTPAAPSTSTPAAPSTSTQASTAAETMTPAQKATPTKNAAPAKTTAPTETVTPAKKAAPAKTTAPANPTAPTESASSTSAGAASSPPEAP